MENEDKKVEETTTEPVIQPTETKEAVKTEEPQLDYKALYAETNERLSKAEFKLKKLNIESKQPVEEVIEEEPQEDLDAIVSRKVSEQLSTLSEDVIEDELNACTNDPDERKLIKLNYDKAIVKSGLNRAAIRHDIQQAKLLANAPRYLKNAKELSETAKSKAGLSNAGGGSNQSPSTQAPDDLKRHFSARDWEFMKGRNWTDEQIRKAIPSKV